MKAIIVFLVLCPTLLFAQNLKKSHIIWMGDEGTDSYALFDNGKIYKVEGEEKLKFEFLYKFDSKELYDEYDMEVHDESINLDKEQLEEYQKENSEMEQDIVELKKDLEKNPEDSLTMIMIEDNERMIERNEKRIYELEESLKKQIDERDKLDKDLNVPAIEKVFKMVQNLIEEEEDSRITKKPAIIYFDGTNKYRFHLSEFENNPEGRKLYKNIEDILYRFI